jgi:hypothetical protein
MAECEILALTEAIDRATVPVRFPMVDPMPSVASIMSPNPTALRAAVKEEDVDKHRNVCCAEYDGCLDAALRHSWRSWSCGRCSLFLHAREWRVAECARMALQRYPT